MKGVLVAIAFVLACGLVLAKPPIDEPEQYEQFCESQLVSGSGLIEAEMTITDRSVALEYRNVMSGDGNIDMDAVHVYSQNADKLVRNLTDCEDPANLDGTSPKKLNFYDNVKMIYDGITPLEGGKFLNSRGLYGGIDANVIETFSVNRIEKDQTAYFGSTENSSVAHTVGLDTLSDFTGTWGTNANMWKIFYKDISSDEEFSGNFSIQKEIKFHETDVPDREIEWPD